MRYYEDGNTVRKIDTYYEEGYYDRYAEDFEERESTKKVRRAGLQKGGQLSRAYGFFLVAMAGLLLFGCIIYLNLRNEITAQQKEIIGLESEYSALKIKNDEELDRIEGNVDMEKIKRIAMDELGMTYPDSGQVVDIESNAGDYVRQYNDIPGDERK